MKLTKYSRAKMHNMLLSKRQLKPAPKDDNKNLDNPDIIVWVVLIVGIIIAVVVLYRKTTS